MTKALITCMHLARHFEKYRSQYETLGVETFIPPFEGQQFSAQEMTRHIVGMETVIAGDDEIDASVLDAGKASGLKAVIKWGIGTDGIDKAHATKLGLPIYNTPGVFSEEVADLAFSHLLMLTRKTHVMDASVRSGGWLKLEGRSISGLTAGIVGLGAIGQAIARRAAGFGMEIVGCDVVALDAERQAALGLRQMEFAEVLAGADILFIACTLTADNRGLIGKNELAMMKPGALLINISRGPLVDEAALAEALASARLGGAGLDVFEEEPLPPNSPLRQQAEFCTFTCHNGSNTAEAVARINQMTTDIAFEVLGLKEAGFELNRVA